jgi:hypothetical protein
MNIYEKLQAARVDLQNKKLKKSGKNKFSGFDYFELSDFLPAINEIFNKQKLFSRFLINDKQATLEIINTEKTDETILFSMPTAELELKGCNKLQALGGVNTYLRRYLYLNALERVEADLFDAEAGKDTKPQKQQKQTEENADASADLDLVNGLKEINNKDELIAYYNQYRQSAHNQLKFGREYATRLKEIEKGA